MNKFLSLTILFALGTASAGTIKLPGSNLNRNAGTSFPVTIQASGFPAGSKATISLVNAKTWAVTPWLTDQPIVNGNNVIHVPIEWSSAENGTRLVKVKIGNNHCTSTWTVRLRTAVIYPWQGVVFTRGQPAAVTWTTPDFFNAHVMEIILYNENNWVVLEEFAENSGRFDFIVPEDIDPGTNYRIDVIGLFIHPGGDFENGGPGFYVEETESTQSEKITIR